MRGLTRFQAKLKSTVSEIKKVSREIDELDGRNVRIKVEVSKKEIADLKADLKTIKDEKVKIKAEPVNVDQTMAEMDALEAELKALDHTDVDVKVTMSGAAKTIAEAEKLNAELDLALNQKRKIRVDFSELSALKSEVMSAASSIKAPGFSLVSAIAAVVPALIPIGAVGTGILAGFTGSVTTAALGVGAFAAFAVPTIKEVAKAVKLLNTDTSLLSGAALKTYNKQLDEMKKKYPAVYKAAKAFEKLKSVYDQAVKALRPDVIKDINIALGIGVYLIGQLKRVAKNVSPAVTGLFRDMREGLKSPEWRAFFRYIQQHSASFITTWGHAVGNFITGIANMIRAFNPLTKWFNKGLLGMSKDFRDWSFRLSNDQGWKNFVKYVKKSAPEVKRFIGGVITFFIGLTKALAPLGNKILNLVNNMLDLYNGFRKNNPELATFLTNMALAAVVLSPFLGTLKSLVPFLVELVGPWAAIGVVAAGVAVAIAFLNKNTKSYKPMMQALSDLWTSAKKTGMDLWNALKNLWNLFKETGSIDQLQQGFTSMFKTIRLLLPVIKPLVYVLGVGLVAALAILIRQWNMAWGIIYHVVAIVSGIVKAIVGAFKWLYNVLVGHSIIPDLVNAIHRWFIRLVGFVMSPLRAIKHGVIAAWNFIKNKTSAAFGEVAGFIRNKLSAAKSFVSGGVSKIKGAVSGAWSAITGATSKAWSNVASFVRNKLSDAKSTASNILGVMKGNAKAAWGNIVSSAGSILGKIKGAVTGAFSDAGSWLLSAGGRIVSGLASGIRSAITGTLGSAMSSVGGFIKSHLPGSPVKRGPLKVLNRGYAGGQITKMIADGIKKKTSYLKQSVRQTVGAVNFRGNGSLAKQLSSSAGSINGSKRVPVGGGGRTRVHNTYKISVNAPVGSNPAEIGKTLVEMISAFEQSGGAAYA
jgi:phage-related protein